MPWICNNCNYINNDEIEICQNCQIPRENNNNSQNQDFYSVLMPLLLARRNSNRNSQNLLIRNGSNGINYQQISGEGEIPQNIPQNHSNSEQNQSNQSQNQSNQSNSEQNVQNVQNPLNNSQSNQNPLLSRQLSQNELDEETLNSLYNIIGNRFEESLSSLIFIILLLSYFLIEYFFEIGFSLYSMWLTWYCNSIITQQMSLKENRSVWSVVMMYLFNIFPIYPIIFVYNKPFLKLLKSLIIYDTGFISDFHDVLCVVIVSDFFIKFTSAMIFKYPTILITSENSRYYQKRVF